MIASYPLSDIILRDESSFRHVGLYDRLKVAMKERDLRFDILSDPEAAGGAHTARLLNLAFWEPSQHAEVLEEPALEADQLMHNAWHVLCREACGEDAQSADGLLLGEAIASAFDVYLLGRLIGHVADSSFVETQVEAMSYVTEDLGINEEDFRTMLQGFTEQPEVSFELLRQRLFDTSTALLASKTLTEAAAVMTENAARPLGELLHHYELPTWVLYARAYATTTEPVASVRAIDASLRNADDAVQWLESHWLS